jgi:calcium-dependent protein kinase
MLCRLDHPNIVKLYDIYDDAQNLYVVTELCEGGDLLHFVNGRCVGEGVMRSVMVQVLSALKYMHSFRILHRDIKLENIVLVDSVSDGERINVKIIDFGISLALASLPQEE